MPWWKNLFIIAYLIVQLALPLRGLLYDKFKTRGNFSWNMYSMIYGCRTQYRLDTPQGETRWLRHEEYFKLPDHYMDVSFRDTLPKFHGWLCNELRRQGELGTLRGYSTCTFNLGPRTELVNPNVDLCTAPNYGVHVRREAFER